MLAILAWTLMAVAVTSDGQGGADLQRQVDEEEEDRCSRFLGDRTAITHTVLLQCTPAQLNSPG